MRQDVIGTCLPAVSADGTTVAVPAIEPDGGRGAPHLTVLFLPVKGTKSEAMKILCADETNGTDIDDAVRAKIAPRAHALEQRLIGYKPLRELALQKVARRRRRRPSSSEPYGE